MSAVRFDIDIFDARLLEFVLFWYDENDALIDLTGATALFTVKREDSHAAAVLIEGAVGSGITVNATPGQVHVKIPASATAGKDFKEGFWELAIQRVGQDPEQLAYGTAFYRSTLRPAIDV